MNRISAFRALWQAVRGQHAPGAPPIGDQLSAIPRMLSATVRGEYPLLDRSRLLLMGLAVAYVISPVDLMPEGLLLVLGLGDDALVASWLAGTLLAETQQFLAWESTRSPARTTQNPRHEQTVVPGEVV